MRMNEQEFRDELVYSVTMAHVKTMLEKGLISEEEYWQINTKMKKKYRPISDVFAVKWNCIKGAPKSEQVIGQ